MTLNDKVRVIICHGRPHLVGKIGTVIGIWPKCVLVEFDEDVSGPIRRHGVSGRQWYFSHQYSLQKLADGDDVEDSSPEEMTTHARLRSEYVGRFWRAMTDPPSKAACEAVKLLNAGALTDGQLKAVVEDMETSMSKLG